MTSRKPSAQDIEDGRLVRRLRGERHWTQEQLAGAVGISASQIGKYERLQNRMSASRLRQMQSVLRPEIEQPQGFIELPSQYAVEPPFDIAEFRRWLTGLRRDADRWLKKIS